MKREEEDRSMVNISFEDLDFEERLRACSMSKPTGKAGIICNTLSLVLVFNLSFNFNINKRHMSVLSMFIAILYQLMLPIHLSSTYAINKALTYYSRLITEILVDRQKYN